MATKKKAAKKKAAPNRKTPLPKIKEQPPIRIIVEVVVRSLEGSSENFSGNKGVVKIFSLSEAAATVDNVALDVKRIILNTIGDTSDPGGLPDSNRLEEDLGYTSDLKIDLNVALNNYVNSKKAGAFITPKEMSDCKTVADCIKLVKSKI